ncbi:hypothetical protein C8E86_5499 [Catellatospora citrea]|nr:hypothetical protein C8E86_5499 [Catellatospora citrea]
MIDADLSNEIIAPLTFVTACEVGVCWFRFPPWVIRGRRTVHLRFSLSYRDVEELLIERGVEADHDTVYRWVQRFSALLADVAGFCRHPPGDRWFVDETWQDRPPRRSSPKPQASKVSLIVRLRDARRHSPHPRLDGQPDAPSPQPQRQPAAQHRSSSHRRNTTEGPPTHQSPGRTPGKPGQLPTRGTASPAPPPCRHRLPPTPKGRSHRAYRPRLDIGDSRGLRFRTSWSLNGLPETSPIIDQRHADPRPWHRHAEPVRWDGHRCTVGDVEIRDERAGRVEADLTHHIAGRLQPKHLRARRPGWGGQDESAPRRAVTAAVEPLTQQRGREFRLDHVDQDCGHDLSRLGKHLDQQRRARIGPITGWKRER